MNDKKKNFKDLVKAGPGRPMFGKERKHGKNLSLDQDVIAWLGDAGASAKANKVLRDAMDKENFDSQG